MASLSPKELMKYEWRRELFIQKIEESSPFVTIDGQTVYIKNDADIKEAIREGNMNRLKLKTVDEEDLSLTNLEKTQEFGGGGSRFGYNKGDAAEAILAFALVAKFSMMKDTITPTDIKHTIKENSVQSGSLLSIVNDMVHWTVNVPQGAWNAVIDPKNWETGELVDVFISASEYANSKNVHRYMRHFKMNMAKDDIYIIADGIGGRGSTKCDVRVEFRTKFNREVKQSRLNVSLKNGAVSQVGQVGGIGFTKLVELFDRFGIDVRHLEEEVADLEEMEAAKTVYEWVANHLSEQLNGKSDSKVEREVFRKIAKGVKYFTVLNSPNIQLVVFDKKKYNIMTFNNLTDKLSGINLAVEVPIDKLRPIIRIYDEETGEDVLKIRLKLDGKYRRNLIEIGSYLKNLCSTM